jgi:hypothetical protein
MTGRQATAVLTTLSGLLFITVVPLVELVAGEFFLLLGVAALLLVLAMPGLHRQQNGEDGSLGLWGVRLSVGGLLLAGVLIVVAEALLSAIGAEDTGETVVAVLAALSALAALVGLVLFGIGMTKSRFYPAVGMWLFLGGMVVALVSESVEQSLQGPVPTLADILPPAGFVVAGVGLIVLGYAAWTRPASRVP